MRYEFTLKYMRELIRTGVISRADSVLTVCADESEKKLFSELKFDDVTISNLNDGIGSDDFSPYRWAHQDAQKLSYPDGSFDFVFVADGLHHCSSPHGAVVEMYRVARKGIIVVESRDNFLMRLAARLNLTPTYELEGVIRHGGTCAGVDNTSVPNHIYRWTEREFEKTIKSYDPTGRQNFRYFYGINLPFLHAEVKKSRFKSVLLRVSQPFLTFGTWIFRKQGNSLFLVALKPRNPDDLWPWIERRNGEAQLNRDYARERFRTNWDDG